jgi:hypothetical protein
MNEKNYYVNKKKTLSLFFAAERKKVKKGKKT